MSLLPSSSYMMKKKMKKMTVVGSTDHLYTRTSKFHSPGAGPPILGTAYEGSAQLLISGVHSSSSLDKILPVDTFESLSQAVIAVSPPAHLTSNVRDASSWWWRYMPSTSQRYVVQEYRKFRFPSV
ncbi:hypothetical protein CY34DRAFT_17144 [Suillus luteus UH-Slu-Lm8-n1]|uniref:Uncharacterized protein n=1 Tax=Suillus luteus UH-Slu-Lm8-n1 TaxID=930992 RepID=A0A0D0AAY1_9AGAM|nr:hypothetical protein CY34DRAFT_17144 [Suillus luteus UH-Slu-Lm8-n1]